MNDTLAEQDRAIAWIELDIDLIDLVELGLVEELPGPRYQLTKAGLAYADQQLGEAA